LLQFLLCVMHLILSYHAQMKPYVCIVLTHIRLICIIILNNIKI
jgi:hypothetical protein